MFSKSIPLVIEKKNCNKSVDLKTALGILGIDQDKLYKLSCFDFVESIQKYLLYLYLKMEFQFIKDKTTNKIDQQQFNKQTEDIKRAYHTILHSTICMEHQNKYSKFSYGLSELDVRSVYRKESDFLAHSVRKIAKKTSGVEPGFLAIQDQDLFLYLYDQYPNDEKRHQFIERYSADKDKILSDVQIKLPKYLIKLSYDVNVSTNQIEPDLADLMRSKKVEASYALSKSKGDIALEAFRKKKIKSTTEKNIEATLEVVSNDIARVFGLLVQDQCLYRGFYKNGSLQLMLKAKWIDNATTLEPLAGSSNQQNYCVKKLAYSCDGLEYISDNSIKNLGHYLALFIAQSDRDSIGKIGQNKLRKNNQLIGIDFGHAYLEKHDLINKLPADLQFYLPEFINYSIFYDVPRSELISGILKLAKLSGMLLDNNVLRSYGDEFYQEISLLPAHEDERIFDDYCQKFKEMQDDFKGGNPITDKSNREDCIAIMTKLAEVKAIAINDRDDLVKRFSPYLKLPKNAINLISHLEKVMAGRENTSHRSPDNKVLLHYLRITHRRVIDWKIDITFENQMILSAICSNPENTALAKEELDNWLITNEDTSFLQINMKNNEIIFTINKNNLDKICEIFNEDKIKETYHLNDYKTYNDYLQKMQEPLFNDISELLTYLATESYKSKERLSSLGLFRDRNSTNETTYLANTLTMFLKHENCDHNVLLNSLEAFKMSTSNTHLYDLINRINDKVQADLNLKKRDDVSSTIQPS